MKSISAAIITLNEESNIERCLNSLQGLADEIIVVDSHSNDDTEKLCRKFNNVKFIEQEFLGHIEQKNLAFEQCTGDYILGIDADEVISDELRASILKIKAELQHDCYSFNRLTNYGGYWVRRCGWYPDIKLRLIKNGKARWQGVNPHDKLVSLNSTIPIHLDGDLYHYSYHSIADHLEQTNKFTTIAARSLFKQGVKSSLFKIISRPILKFLKDYILKKGFLDGWRGLIICTINGLYAFLKYAKLYELEKTSLHN